MLKLDTNKQLVHEKPKAYFFLLRVLNKYRIENRVSSEGEVKCLETN